MLPIKPRLPTRRPVCVSSKKRPHLNVPPPSHSCRKRLARPLGSSPGGRSDRWGGCAAEASLSGGCRLQLGTSSTSTASPNCAECLRNKDDTNCWMWRLWFYSRKEAATAMMTLQRMENTPRSHTFQDVGFSPRVETRVSARRFEKSPTRASRSFLQCS